MRKLKSITAIILITAFFLTSCSSVKEVVEETTLETTSKVVETEVEVTETSATEINLNDYERLNCQIDYYKVPELTTTVLSTRITDAACMVIDAFFNRETEIYFGDYMEWEVEYVGGVLRIMCPPAVAFTDYSAFKNYNQNTGVLTLNYYYDEAETSAKIEEFEEAAYRYFELLGENDTDVMKAMVLYYAYSKNLSYNYSLADCPDDFEPIDLQYVSSSCCAITEGTGVCYCLSQGLAFLYNQVGIPVETVSNYGDETNAVAHAWVIARLDGDYYYIDPTWGILDSDEYGSIYYFGMTESERYDLGGGYLPEYTTIWWEPVSDYFDVNDNRFIALHVPAFMWVDRFIPNHIEQTIRIVSGDYRVIFDCANR